MSISAEWNRTSIESNSKQNNSVAVPIGTNSVLEPLQHDRGIRRHVRNVLWFSLWNELVEWYSTRCI